MREVLATLTTHSSSFIRWIATIINPIALQAIRQTKTIRTLELIFGASCAENKTIYMESYWWSYGIKRSNWAIVTKLMRTLIKWECDWHLCISHKLRVGERVSVEYNDTDNNNLAILTINALWNQEILLFYLHLYWEWYLDNCVESVHSNADRHEWFLDS